MLLDYLIYLRQTFINGSSTAFATNGAVKLASMIVGELLFGFLLTSALIKSDAIANIASSAKTGALIGWLIALASMLLLFNMTTVQGAFFSGVTSAVRWAIAGAIVSMCFRVGREGKNIAPQEHAPL